MLPAACTGPATRPARDFSAWLASDHAVEVREVARSADCGNRRSSPGVHGFPDRASLRDWAATRELRLSATRGEPLPETPFAVIELGRQAGQGYGLAVHRVAGLRDRALLLQATLFRPTERAGRKAVERAPCVVVSLPARDYASIHAIDQDRRLIAAWAAHRF